MVAAGRARTGEDVRLPRLWEGARDRPGQQPPFDQPLRLDQTRAHVLPLDERSRLEQAPWLDLPPRLDPPPPQLHPPPQMDPPPRLEPTSHMDHALRIGQTQSAPASRRARGSGSHVCSLCGYAANQSSDLKRHLATHQNLRPFPCDAHGCFRRFRQKAHLIAHRRAIHLRLKAFACTLCPADFAARSSLKRHVTYVHGRKDAPFVCADCAKEYNDVWALSCHRAEKHPRIPGGGSGGGGVGGGAAEADLDDDGDHHSDDGDPGDDDDDPGDDDDDDDFEDRDDVATSPVAAAGPAQYPPPTAYDYTYLPPLSVHQSPPSTHIHRIAPPHLGLGLFPPPPQPGALPVYQPYGGPGFGYMQHVSRVEHAPHYASPSPLHVEQAHRYSTSHSSPPLPPPLPPTDARQPHHYYGAPEPFSTPLTNGAPEHDAQEARHRPPPDTSEVPHIHGARGRGRGRPRRQGDRDSFQSRQ